MVAMIAPDPATVVVFGSGFLGRPCEPGDKGGPAPVKACLRALQRVRKVVMVNEFRTSKLSYCCGVQTAGTGQYRVRRCTLCNAKFDRDFNAARNLKKCFVQHAQDGARPPGMELPAHQWWV